VWARTYPLLPPIPIVVLRGGMERTTTAHAMACEGSGVRGFGGSRVRFPGLTPKGSSALGVRVASKHSPPSIMSAQRLAVPD
jgi:hypothetical protein